MVPFHCAIHHQMLSTPPLQRLAPGNGKQMFCSLNVAISVKEGSDARSRHESGRPGTQAEVSKRRGSAWGSVCAHRRLPPMTPPTSDGGYRGAKLEVPTATRPRPQPAPATSRIPSAPPRLCDLATPCLEVVSLLTRQARLLSEALIGWGLDRSGL